jgi:GNAT superfamily N-acetyltransferase
MKNPELNLELARRIEIAEARAAVAAAQKLKRSRPESGAAVEQLAGGYAVYTGANSPITQAVGVGLDGEVSAEEFDKLEEFYRNRNEPVRVETCPLANESIFQLYGRRHYRVTEFTNVMARPVEGIMQSSEPRDHVKVEKVRPDQIDVWTLTVSQGFAEQHPVTQELIEVMRMFAQGPNTECYLARVDGKIAGGATLALRDGVAGLFGASTLPAFRNRGVQTALVNARLASAAEAKCDLAVSLARPGSTSQRNIVRRGFAVLYTRVKFERDCE